MTFKATLFAAATILALSPASAQDEHAGHGQPAQTGTAATGSVVAELPEICLAAAAPADAMPMTHEMDPAHTDLMAGMDENNQLMMTAGMAEDIDIAFVCAMIPHHQSAINMARAELEHGDNAWARDMAQTIIAAQEAEIAGMLNWLETEAQTE